MDTYRDDEPPVFEEGERLATLQRKGGRDRPDTEVRLNLCAVNGHHFIKLQEWEYRNSRFYYTPKAITIRRRELDEMIEALSRARATLDKLQPSEPARRHEPRARRPVAATEGGRA